MTNEYNKRENRLRPYIGTCGGKNNKIKQVKKRKKTLVREINDNIKAIGFKHAFFLSLFATNHNLIQT